MLNRLLIKNYALIDDLDIGFSKELNILTGETGAGKSIILGALSLILGQRIDGKYFFNQQKKCIIEGFFRIKEYRLESFFNENELDFEDDTVLRREISADGKSRAFINDTPVNLATLKRLGEQLIDIHSQHATLEINDESFQLLVVDTLAGHQALLKQYEENFKTYRKKQAELKDLNEEYEKAKAEQDYFQFLFDELEKAEIIQNEQETLEQEQTTLTHAEEIKRCLFAASFVLNEGENSALQQLKEALQQLQQAEKYHSAMSGLAERLKSSLIEIKDITAEVDDLESGISFNEARTVEINERLSAIYNLQKKHRVNSDAELIKIREDLSNKLFSISNREEEIDQLKEEIRYLFNELIGTSDTISASRNEVIPAIEQKVKQTLEEVGMPYATLKIENILLEEEQLTRTGRNKIQFLFSANKGQDLAPVSKVASGGELSRLMLSIKSLIAKHTALPTIIFDEIDTGISGEVALKVGSILEQLSQNMQVLAITHLPQMASKGNAHYKVYKDDREEKTYTNIKLLQQEERVIEIAIMLSGENPGEFALQHAKELLST